MKRLLWLLSISLIPLLITACPGIGGDAPTLINLTGTVIDFRQQPVASARVFIASGGTIFSTTTDASGVFTVSGVTRPYDATVVVEDEHRNLSLTYKGLTRTDPTLLFPGFGSAPRSASLSGTISGGAGLPSPPEHQTQTAFGSPEAGIGMFAVTRNLDPNTGVNEMTVHWPGPATITGNIHALQWRFDANHLPADYTGYGVRRSVTLTDGGTFVGQNVTMSPVSEATIRGSVTLPTGYNLESKHLAVSFADGSLISVLHDSGTSTSFAYTTPRLDGATIHMQVFASNAAGTRVSTAKPGLAVDATGVSIPLPAGSEPISPPDAATGVNHSTHFSYTPFSGGVHVVMFQGTGANPSYVVVTSAASARIPDLSSVWRGLPRSTVYDWQVIGVAPLATVDAAAAGDLQAVLLLGGRISTSTSASRTFTTAP